MLTLGTYRWYVAEIPTATLLALALNKAESEGFEVFTVTRGEEGGFVLALRVLVTTANRKHLEEYDHAKEKAAAQVAGDSRSAVPIDTPQAVPVGAPSVKTGRVEHAVQPNNGRGKRVRGPAVAADRPAKG